MSRSHRLRSAFAALAGAAVLASRANAGSVVYVDDDASAGGDGTDWATAYKFLQDALANVDAATEIRVGQGVYKPDEDELNPTGTGEKNATFQMINGVAIRGGYAGVVAPTPDEHNIALYETILSGDLQGDDIPDLVAGLACHSGIDIPLELGCESYDVDGDGDVDTFDLLTSENSYHVVTSNGTDATAILDGVTITAGNAVSCCIPNDRGGGIQNDLGGSPTISNSVLKANFAKAGGAITNQLNGSPSLIDCSFVGNRAAEQGGAIFSKTTTANPLLVSCRFHENRSPTGGAVYLIRSATFINCTFLNNTALEGLGRGGALYLHSGAAELTNCTFSANAAVDGGAIFHDACGLGPCVTTVLNNCILWGNSASGSGNHIFKVSLPATISCCDVEGSGGSGAGWDSSLGNDGGGNIDSNPLFVGPDDLRLGSGSPSIDAGNNWLVPSDSADVDGDGDTSEPVPTDLDGNSRFADGAGGVCSGSISVDMGAYEVLGPAATCIMIGDVDGSGTVNVLDLVALLLDFGTACGTGCCAADFNADGVVNVLDLIDLLVAFGTTCS